MRKMLKDFKGVMVYHHPISIRLRRAPLVWQQRSPYQLMRDMNRSILDNPFDQGASVHYGSRLRLLRSIVVTVMAWPRTQVPKSHCGAEATFFDALTERIYESNTPSLARASTPTSRAWFTFLQHDGVSWKTICEGTRSSASALPGRCRTNRQRSGSLPRIWYC